MWRTVKNRTGHGDHRVLIWRALVECYGRRRSPPLSAAAIGPRREVRGQLQGCLRARTEIADIRRRHVGDVDPARATPGHEEAHPIEGHGSASCRPVGKRERRQYLVGGRWCVLDRIDLSAGGCNREGEVSVR